MAWHYSEWGEEDVHRKVKSVIVHVRFPASLEYFDRISTASYIEMEVALTPTFKSVAICNIEEAHAYINRMAVEVLAVEASTACKVTSKRIKSL